MQFYVEIYVYACTGEKHFHFSCIIFPTIISRSLHTVLSLSRLKTKYRSTMCLFSLGVLLLSLHADTLESLGGNGKSIQMLWLWLSQNYVNLVICGLLESELGGFQKYRLHSTPSRIVINRMKMWDVVYNLICRNGLELLELAFDGTK